MEILINQTKPKLKLTKPNRTLNTKTVTTNDASQSNSTITNTKSKKAKRLPWNTEVLSDRITPQPYQIQIVDECTSTENKNSIIFMKTDEWKNYYKLMILKQFALKSVKNPTKSLFLIVTNMGSDVSKEVEMVSRHTTYKLAGIDFNLINNTNQFSETTTSHQNDLKNENYYLKLKNEAQILIMSINTLVEWLKRCYLSPSEIMLILFDDVNGAFHNEMYKTLMDTYLTSKSMSTVGFATLCIEATTTHKQLIKHIDFLKNLFKCDYVETATDLLDTYNMFHGIEPSENVQICDSVKLAYSSETTNQSKIFEASKPIDSDEFQSQLISIIRETYTFLEDLSSTGTNAESLVYIHQLCNRVLNECIYLLNEVGIWCFAKSLLPFICQLDKLSAYIENSTKSKKQEEEKIVKDLDDANLQQQLVLQYTSTSLRRIRELCIKQFLISKNYNHLMKLKQSPTVNGQFSLDLFVKNFTTPKVNSLIQLLKKYRESASQFCCLVFVQNKQVATSLSLLLKKLAKEDASLSYLFPNYVIGTSSAASSSSSSSDSTNNNTTTNGSSPTSFNSKFSEAKTISSFLNNTKENETAHSSGQTNDCLKQEEILRKFHSGDINLLICTFEMEEHISVPACVNLIIRFNCSTSSDNTFDYFSYIGTKSRAQSRNASCYFFIERTRFDSFFTQYIRCKQIEETLAKTYSSLIKQNRANSLSKKLSKQRLGLDNAVQVVNKYCIRLPSDALTQLTARSLIKQEGAKFKCTIYLPINSGCRDPIESDWETSVDLAQAAACYKVCLVLFCKSELNDLLEPITKEIFYKLNNKSDADDEREWSQFSAYFQKINTGACLSQQQIANYMSHRPGGNKRKQTYAKKVSSYMKSNQIISTQYQVYLYTFKCTLTTPLVNAPELASTTWCFGLLASKIMLEIVDFPVFTQSGEETVRVELVKTGIFLTPNQLKLIKTFHKFLFSNVLRMEGCGAVPLPYLLDTAKPSQSSGCYVCILNSEQEIDWNLMRTIEACSDKHFLKIPKHARRIEDAEDEERREDFKFDESKYLDAVVIPFYRSSDVNPQFYCVSSIDYGTTPLSTFPVSSSSSAASQYETFYQYFALKYNYLITNVEQPMLMVSHPSTRLNLLTPRYMNMKANVIQKSYHYQVTSSSTTAKTSKKSSNSKIFLVPELVNIHPLSASILRRSLCLPSILYRLNSLLLAEELRREIAQATGVGVPWHCETNSFEKLSFHWDKNREIEICDVPDLEIDAATINQQRKYDDDLASTLNPLTGEANSCDSKWNFEISEWDESVLLNNNTAKKVEPNIKQNSKVFAESDQNGWSDMFFDPKTLFIDPTEMDLLAEDDYYMDDDSEGESNEFDYSRARKNATNDKQQQQQQLTETDSNEEDSFDEDDEEKYEETKSERVNSSNLPKSQFTIDLDKLKADLRKKSAKLLSKLSVSSSSCNLVKNLAACTFDYTAKASEFDLDDVAASCSSFQLDFNSEYTSQLLLNRTNSKCELNRDALIDEKVLNWIDKVTFKVDSDSESNKLNETIRKKYFESVLNQVKLEKNSNSEQLLDHLTSNYPQVSVPLKKDEIIRLLEASNQNEAKKSNAKLDTSKWTGTTTTSFRNTDWTFDFTLDDTQKLESFNDIGPGPALILQALTLSNAADGFDLERLETVGDSFLKQAITVYLYLTYPNVHEGKLSYLRSKQVSNYNLYKLGKRKGLQEIIMSTKFEPLESWLPPHYDSSLSLSSNSKLASVFGARKSSTDTSSAQFDKYKDHILSDKSIADCVEAIIGAYLITSGPQAALKIMTWFDLKVLPKAKCEDGSEVLVNMPDIPEPVINDPVLLRSLLDGFASFEAMIGYKFKQPVYLLQAFTHASYTYNTITDCYQRLEFLGDAILDYVITRHLYEDKKCHSPGELTDLRSSLVNNNIFAHLAVKYEFYKYFRYLSPSLFTIIDNFVRNQKNRNDEFDLDEDVSLKN